jgi:dTDP-glucose 4,6-dehydratase
MKKKILIIGSNSFAGASLINFLLEKNYEVYGCSRRKQILKPYLLYKKNSNLKNFFFFKTDINKCTKKLIKLIKRNKIKYIINFTAQGMVEESWTNPDHWYNTNVVSQVKLIEKIKKIKFIKKYINFSTPEVYGNTKLWCKENAFHNPTTPYATSRSCLDVHLINLHKFYNFPCIITRTANIYGPGQQLYRIVPKVIMSICRKIKIPLHGNGASLRSFIHMTDVCEAIYKILNKGKLGNVYHISTNKIISVSNLVKIILKTMNKKFDHNVKLEKDRIGKDKCYKLDSSKIRNKLKWNDEISLQKGIEETISWISENYSELCKEKLSYTHIK